MNDGAGWHLAYAPQLIVYHYPSSRRDVGTRRRLLLRKARRTATGMSIAANWKDSPERLEAFPGGDHFRSWP